MSKELLTQLPTIISLSPIIGLAFSASVRKLAGQRDNWTCQEDGCDKSFQTGWNVQITHENHDKSNPFYNDPSIAKTRCVEHHLEQHVNAIGNEEAIGLCVQANNYAISQLQKTEHHTWWWKKQNK